MRLRRLAAQLLQPGLLPRPGQGQPPRVQRQPSRQRPSTRQLWLRCAWPRLPARQLSLLRQRHAPAWRSPPWDVPACLQWPEQASMSWVPPQLSVSFQPTRLKSPRVQLRFRCAQVQPPHRRKLHSSVLPSSTPPAVFWALMLCVPRSCSRQRHAQQAYELRRAFSLESCEPEACAVPSRSRHPSTARHRRQLVERPAYERPVCVWRACETLACDQLPGAARVQAVWNRAECPWCAPPEQFAVRPPPPGNPHPSRSPLLTRSMQMTVIQMLTVTTHRWQHHPVRRSMRHLAEEAVVQKSLR